MILLFSLYLIIFTLGLNFGLSLNPYDESRIFYIFLSCIAGLNILIFSKKNYYNNADKFLFYILFFVIFFILDKKNIFQIYDFVMWISLFFLTISISKIDFDTTANKNLLSILVIISIIPCLFLPIVIFEFVKNSKMYDWQMNAGSIRIYDSMIVPIFWISVFLKNKKNKIISTAYPFVCFLIILGLLIDSARSALISIFVPILLLYLSSKEHRSLALNTAMWFILAVLTYKLIFYYHNFYSNDYKLLSIARFSTSYRYEIWEFMYEEWKKNPLFGSGGGYLAEVQFKYVHHMHNVYLRLIFEWGLIGLSLLIWVLIKVYFLLKSNISIILKMGVTAILIDAAFSGNFIYPASQVACILFIGIAFSANKFDTSNQNSNKYSKLLLMVWYFLFIGLVFFYLGRDLTCLGCFSNDGRAAPFFWEHGGSIKLISNDTND